MVSMFMKSGFKGATLSDIIHSTHRVLAQEDLWGTARYNAVELTRTGKPAFVCFATDDKLIEPAR